MTTAGPEPGWCLDPDGGENERYWNGIEWTEHRRSPRPTVSQPPGSFSRPADMVDSMAGSMLDARQQAGSVLEQGVRSQDADTLTPSSNWSSNPPTTWATSTVERPVDWPGEADTPAEKPVPRRRRSVAYYLFVVLAVISAALTLVFGLNFILGNVTPSGRGGVLVATLWSGAWTALWVRLARRRKVRSENPDPTSESPATQTPEAAPPSESTELRLGGMAKVMGGNRWFIGRVGKIVAIDSDRIGLKCKGRWGKRYFWRNHVVPAATEDQPDGRLTPKSSPPDPAGGPAPTLQPPPSLKLATAQPFPQPLISASDQVPKVKQFWAGLPTAGRIAVIVVPVLAAVAVIAAIANTGQRDAASYAYGRQWVSQQAQGLWNADLATDAELGPGGTLRTGEDACRIVMDGTDWEALGYEEDDVLDGCVDVVGHLRQP
jgi:hypothetical protein